MKKINYYKFLKIFEKKEKNCGPMFLFVSKLDKIQKIKLFKFLARDLFSFDSWSKTEINLLGKLGLLGWFFNKEEVEKIIKTREVKK